MSEARIENINKQVIKIVEDAMGSNETTMGSEINKWGKLFLGSGFVGVFTADMIPNLKNGQSIIANLDSSDMAGSHWVSIMKEKNNLYFYDSFGRKGKKIMKHATKKIRHMLIEEANLDQEQDIFETNCGQRSIAFLLIAQHWGVDTALLI